MRQASYGMGATRWQTVKNVVLPEAFPGILTGTIPRCVVATAVNHPQQRRPPLRKYQPVLRQQRRLIR